MAALGFRLHQSFIQNFYLDPEAPIKVLLSVDGHQIIIAMEIGARENLLNHLADIAPILIIF